jgi:hypothetical protein
MNEVEQLMEEIRALPHRARTLLRDIYGRPDWSQVRFDLNAPILVKRWSQQSLRRNHMVNLTRLGLLQVQPAGGRMQTVADESVRQAVLLATGGLGLRQPAEGDKAEAQW